MHVKCGICPKPSLVQAVIFNFKNVLQKYHFYFNIKIILKFSCII